MLNRVSLKHKLSLIFVGLLVLPTILIGVIGLHHIRHYGVQSMEESNETLTDQTLRTLQAGVENDRRLVESIVEKAREDLVDTTLSPEMRRYFAIKNGIDPLAAEIAREDARQVVSSIYNGCSAQRTLLKEGLKADMSVAEYILASRGGLKETALTARWRVKEQTTGEIREVVLPYLNVGFDMVNMTSDSAAYVPVVDRVKTLIGGTCTLFQRMNDAGDMLRVATNVTRSDGTRGVGTFISAVDPDGERNPVANAVLEGEVFIGRAFVVDDWYLSAYKGIKDEKGRIIGMLFVGRKEQDNNALLDVLFNTSVGDTGYPLVMDSRGMVILHPDPDVVGKHAVDDLGIPEFRTILDSPENEKMEAISYEFRGQRKFAVYRYLKEWDWIILATGYWDDYKRIGNAEKQLFEEVTTVHGRRVRVADGELPVYHRIRFLDQPAGDCRHPSQIPGPGRTRHRQTRIRQTLRSVP